MAKTTTTRRRRKAARPRPQPDVPKMKKAVTINRFPVLNVALAIGAAAGLFVAFMA